MKVTANNGSVLVPPINWNVIEDPQDLEVWDRVNANNWLPQKVQLGGDVPVYKNMSPQWQDVVRKVFSGLTVLDTIQSIVGVPCLIPDARTQHEEAVLSQFAYMECFTGEHQLLTPQGWKFVHQITADDLVLQYDAETKNTKFVPPIALSSHFAPETYLITDTKGRMRQHVSPGHRVLLERKKENNEWIPEVIEAKNLTSHDFTSKTRFPLSASLDGGLRGTVQKSTDLELALLSMSSKDNGANRVYSVHNYQMNDFTQVLDSNNVQYKVSDGEPGVTLITVDSSIVPQKLSLDIENMSLSQARMLCERIFGKWGSTIEHPDHEDTWALSHDNHEFVETLRTIALLAGFSTKIVSHSNFGEHKMSWTVFAGGEKYVYGNTVNIAQMTGEQVWGIEVEGTFLVTKNRESIVITGNCVHAKSYSSIFATLCSLEESNRALEWSLNNELMQNKQKIIVEQYEKHGLDADPLKKKIASTMLESFMFYSGFFTPIYLASRGKLTNTADLIRLIVRDEAVHGYYIGYKFKRGFAEATPEHQRELIDFANELFQKLYENEIKYTHEIYDVLGSEIVNEVLAFLRYNACKAFQNLGLEEPFGANEIRVSPEIINGLNVRGDEVNDYFSGSGSAYVMGDTAGSVDWDDDDDDF